MTAPARRSALRVAEALVKAKRGNYYVHGWSSQIDRIDVEMLMLAAFSPTEVATYWKAIEESDK